MNKKYRAVVIGCGRIGALWGIDSAEVQPASHAAAIVANQRTELVGLVDVNAEVLHKAGAFFGAQTFNTAEDSLEQKPDIVIIATPPSTHEELLETVLRSNPPAVVCEKPLSDSTESAWRMLEMTTVAKSIVVVTYQRRFFPLYHAARRRIQDGELGDIHEIQGVYSRGLLNNGSHLIDAIRLLTGNEALYVEGNTIKYASGALATFSTVPDTIEQHDLTLVGTKGSLFITDFGYRFEWGSGEVQTDKFGMVEPTIRHIVECLDGRAPLCTPQDGYKAVQIVESMLRSAQEWGAPIMI
ncbi:MAG: Gfo/Idh/MocA family oxidoreductase [bacterium]|nr:Gfo/Idh/MocA family oxidoreductase [bacterium]